MGLNFLTGYLVVFCGCLLYLSIFGDGKALIDIALRVVESLVLPLVGIASLFAFYDLLGVLS